MGAMTSSNTEHLAQPLVKEANWSKFDLLKRIAICFGATYFFWRIWLFDLPVLTRPVWSIVRLVDPDGLALISVGMTVLATVCSLILALLTRGLGYSWFVPGVVILGVTLNVVGVTVLGGMSAATWVWLTLQVVILMAMVWMALRQQPRFAYLAGAAILAYAWLGTSPDLSNIPVEVLGAEFDHERRAYTAIVKDVDGKVRSLTVGERYVKDITGMLLPELVEEGYKGYNIIRFRDRLYGIRQADGPWGLLKFQAGGYTHPVEGKSLEEVKQKIDSLPPGASLPELVEEGYKGYNIIRQGNHYYGIRQADGAWSLGRFEIGGYTDAVEGASVDEVKQKIDALLPQKAG